MTDVRALPPEPAGMPVRGDAAWHRRGALLLLAIVVTALGSFQLCDYDVFYHAALGREILARGSPILTEPFSHTAEGFRMAPHEWLFQVGCRLAVLAAGEVGLQLLRLVLLLAAFLLLQRQAVCRGAGPWCAATVLTLAAVGARSVFLARPALVSLLGLAILSALADQLEREPKPAALLAAGAVLGALWANSHPGILMAWPLLLLVGLELLARSAERGRRLRGWLGLSLGLALGSALVPDFPAGFLYPVRLLLGDPVPQVAFIEEFRPLTLSARFAGAWLLLALALVMAPVVRGRSRWSTLLFGLLMMLLALRYRRNLLLATPFLALDLSVRLGAWRPHRVTARRLLRRSAPAAAVLACLLMVAATLQSSEYLMRPGAGANPMAYPVAVARVLREEGLAGPIYNSYSLGGYLAHHRVPPLRIYQSGEADSSREAFRALARPDLDRVFGETYPLDLAVVCWLPRELRRVAAYFGENVEEWALVAWDDVAALYARRTPEHRELIARREYRWLRKADPLAPPSPEAARGLLEELRRARREAPESRRVRYLTGGLLAAMGRYDQALVELEAAAEKYRRTPRYRRLLERVRRAAGSS